MASSAAAARRGRQTAPKRRPPSGTHVPWWGKGRPPHKRWPGATIELPATWSRARSRWESPEGRYYFDLEAADKACDFFPTFLTHHIGEYSGQAFELLDWQRFLTRAIFGWMRRSDGLRRFRKVFVFIPKGNGKSPWASGTGVFMTLCDNEEGSEVYALAADKLQAKVVHKTARFMVEQSADLAERCQVLTDAIYCPESKSSFQVLSAEAKTKSGVRPHGIIMDELQEQPNRDLLETLEQSMGKRRQPLIMMLAHAGEDDEGICYEEFTFAKGVISGTIAEETYLPLVFEAELEDDWRSPATWKKTNPAYGTLVRQDDMERQSRAAEQEPRKLSAFLRYRINRWTNDAIAWIPIEDWDACDTPPSFETGLLAAAGLDMAQRIDLAAFAVMVRHPLPDGKALSLEISGQADVVEDGEPAVAPAAPAADAAPLKLSLNFAVSLFAHFWMPEDTMRKREKEDRVPYGLWAAKGLVTPTPGVMIREDRILADIRDRLVPRFELKARRCGYDPAFVSTSLLNGLADAGLQMVETKQNYQMMNMPCQALFGLIKAKWLRHGTSKLSHPLRWCAENVAIRQDDAGRIRPVKPRNQRKRIDGIVAGAMAMDQLLREPPPQPPQSYHVDWIG